VGLGLLRLTDGGDQSAAVANELAALAVLAVNAAAEKTLAPSTTTVQQGCDDPDGGPGLRRGGWTAVVRSRTGSAVSCVPAAGELPAVPAEADSAEDGGGHGSHGDDGPQGEGREVTAVQPESGQSDAGDQQACLPANLVAGQGSAVHIVVGVAGCHVGAVVMGRDDTVQAGLLNPAGFRS
jgi:hypothetical protein